MWKPDEVTVNETADLAFADELDALSSLVRERRKFAGESDTQIGMALLTLNDSANKYQFRFFGMKPMSEPVFNETLLLQEIQEAGKLTR